MPRAIRLGSNYAVALDLATEMGVERIVQRLIEFTEMLSDYKVDVYELVAMKMLFLLSPGEYFIIFSLILL